MHQPSYVHPRSLRAFTLMEVMVAVLVLAVAISTVMGSIANLHTMRRGSEDLRQAHQVADYMVASLQGTNWDDLNDLSKDDAYLSWTRLPDADGSGTIDDDTVCLTDANAPMLIGAGDPRQRRMLPFSTGLLDLRVYLEYYRAVTAYDANGHVMTNGVNYCFAGLLQGTLVRTTTPGGETWVIDPSTGVDLTPGSSSLSDVNHTQSALSGVSLGERIPNGAGFNNRIAPVTIKPLSVDVNGDGVNDNLEPIRFDANTTISIASLSATEIGPNDPVAARIIVSWKDRDALTSGAGAQRRQLVVITGLNR